MSVNEEPSIVRVDGLKGSSLEVGSMVARVLSVEVKVFKQCGSGYDRRVNGIARLVRMIRRSRIWAFKAVVIVNRLYLEPR